jgi:hypothetical protein
MSARSIFVARQAAKRARRIALALRAAPPHIAERFVEVFDDIGTSLDELALAVDLLCDEAQVLDEAHR